LTPCRLSVILNLPTRSRLLKEGEMGNWPTEGSSGAADRARRNDELRSVTSFVEHQVRSIVLSDYFPCVGARSAFKSGGYAFHLYNDMARADVIDSVAVDLREFIADPPSAGPFVTFVASFMNPTGIHDESHWDALVWRALQFLHVSDFQSWDTSVSDDPSSPDFSFSFGGRAFFVVGLHPGSSRYSRRFAWPSLVFNLHEQFERLRAEGKYARFQDTIRTRDVRLQGSLNPNLSDFGDASDAAQYSGMPAGSSWRCPFASKDQEKETENEEKKVA
jgi:uncharacterized protein